jgi:hypothetical protein
MVRSGTILYLATPEDLVKNLAFASSTRRREICNHHIHADIFTAA